MLLLKKVKIIHPGTSLHGKTRDIFLKNGKIEQIKSSITEKSLSGKVKVVQQKGLCVAPGFLDMFALIGDPGFEHREDFDSARRAASAGGFTKVACLPNTHPAIHSKSEVEYILAKNHDSLVEFLPIGAVSIDVKGKDITEMYDMHSSGAVAFSDGKKPIKNGGLLLRALQYVLSFNGLVFNSPMDQDIAEDGQMHEGKTSTSLGLKGVPVLAETLMLQRDIELLEYSGSRLHVTNVSSAESVDLIRKAKKRGLSITASVAVMNLAFTDEDLKDFNSQLKVLPVIRSKKDRSALIKGLKDGTIDAIHSNHQPLEPEAKLCEFQYANFGATGLETAFSTAFSALKGDLDLIVERFAIGPRQVLNLPIPEISVGAKAELTLFDEGKWTYERRGRFSKSDNSPFIGETLNGKISGVINKKNYWLNKN